MSAHSSCVVTCDYPNNDCRNDFAGDDGDDVDTVRKASHQYNWITRSTMQGVQDFCPHHRQWGLGPPS